MSFTELLEAYQENGIRGLDEACKKKKMVAKEEVDNETFTKELKDQIASMEGKKKQPPVAAAATQGVKNMDEEKKYSFWDKDWYERNKDKRVYPDVQKDKKKNDVLNKEEVGETEIEERTLTPDELEKKEQYVKGMKKNLKGFKDRYGERAKEVAYATATKMAKED